VVWSRSAMRTALSVRDEGQNQINPDDVNETHDPCSRVEPLCVIQLRRVCSSYCAGVVSFISSSVYLFSARCLQKGLDFLSGSRFFSYPQRPSRLWTHTASYPLGTRGGGVMAAGW
jgi:hypothetical protein